jgi:RimJ/RimL family protein N-acetyltransferase
MYLETERLIIRAFQPQSDALHGLDIYGDPQVTQWIGTEDADHSIHEVQGRLQRYVSLASGQNPKLGIWAIVEKAIDRLIGTVLLIPLPGLAGSPSGEIEIGWHLRRASWGYGYATEAAGAIATYGFKEVGLKEIYAVTLAENRRSIAVMKRLGMEEVGMSQAYYGGRELLVYRLKRLMVDEIAKMNKTDV